MQGKIIKGIGGFYYVHDGIGKVYECRAKGIFRNRGIKPLVGDDVEISVLDEEKATGNLDEILPRKNRLIRPAVSNVDQAVVVFAITDPMPNLNLLDRFLVMMERQEVPVSICFNKIDLVDAAEQEKLRGCSFRLTGKLSGTARIRFSFRNKYRLIEVSSFSIAVSNTRSSDSFSNPAFSSRVFPSVRSIVTCGYFV